MQATRLESRDLQPLELTCVSCPVLWPQHSLSCWRTYRVLRGVLMAMRRSGKARRKLLCVALVGWGETNQRCYHVGILGGNEEGARKWMFPLR